MEGSLGLQLKRFIWNTRARGHARDKTGTGALLTEGDGDCMAMVLNAGPRDLLRNSARRPTGG